MNTPNLVSKFAWLKLVGALTLANLCGLQQNAGAAEGHWVTTWGSGPQLTEKTNLPPAPLANSTLRQFVRNSIGGKFVRVRFTNAYGAESVTINSTHIALAAGTGSAGTGEIDPATDKPLTFRGAPTVVIPPGAVVYSDSLEFDLPAVGDVALSVYFGKLSSTTICGHPGSRTTSFIKPGNTVAEANMADATTTAHWYIISGIEVLGAMNSRTVVALGDSITDGRGSTTNGNTRWPDYLAQRLSASAPTAKVGVANMGIGGGGIFGGLGPSALNRFQRDVLTQNGARWVILFIGVNDIGGAADGTGATLAQNMIAAYTTFASQAHARNILVYAATVTPSAATTLRITKARGKPSTSGFGPPRFATAVSTSTPPCAIRPIQLISCQPTSPMVCI